MKLQEVIILEPYKSYGRGQCGRGNSSCGQNPRNMNHSPYASNRSCGSNQPRANSSCHTAIDNILSGNCDSDCHDSNHHMHHMPVAMAYVPMQKWGELYDPETAICQGTAFPELNLIFCGSRGKM